MKEGVRADHVWLVLQHNTALDLCGLEIIERAERLVSNTLVGERPQALAGLQFWCMGRQEEQVDAFGDNELFAAMPAGLIQDQQDALRRACADGLGELRQRYRKHIRPHRWQEQPLRLSRSRLHKTVEVEPLKAMLHRDPRPGTFSHPDPAQDRFEPDTVVPATCDIRSLNEAFETTFPRLSLLLIPQRESRIARYSYHFLMMTRVFLWGEA